MTSISIHTVNDASDNGGMEHILFEQRTVAILVPIGLFSTYILFSK